MGVKITYDQDKLRISCSGIDRIYTFASAMEVPRSAIRSARVMDIAEAKEDLGWRVGGGYFPGRLATGWFLSRGNTSGRQWWCTYRDREVLVIDTTLKSPSRVVNQTPERAALAAELNP